MDADLLRIFSCSFRGNEDFFVVHQTPFTYNEKEEKTTASWCGFAKYGSKSFPDIPEGYEAGDFVPVTEDIYKDHLEGIRGIAIAPIMTTGKYKNVCCHAVLDIDVQANFTWLVNTLYRHGFRFAAFPSKSGGLHIYFFFEGYEPAVKARETLQKVVEAFGLYALYGKDRVEIFPKQAIRTGEQNAGCLLLPFFDEVHKSNQRLLTAEGKLLGIVKAMPVIEGMFTTLRELNKTLLDLPYSDAPYCMQAILLNGALQEGDHRNDFLFAAAIYLKKKEKENFKHTLQEMNDCLQVPLEQRAIDDIYTSATDAHKNYETWSCKKPPMLLYCDKTLCASREYYPHRVKGGHFTGADCWGELSVVNAAEPYYIWKVKVPGCEEYQDLKIDNTRDLQNQIAVQRYCLRDLYWMPYRVKDVQWTDIINLALQGAKNRLIPVSEASDTSERAVLRNLFRRYLTSAQIQNDKPYMVGVGLVYRAEGFYYFKLDGLMDFLRTKKFYYGSINLHKELENYGCSDGVVTYRTSSGKEKTIRCLKKAEDDDLLSMDAFYKDIYDGSADIVGEQDNETERQETSDDSIKF
jgi:hypothetical protein